MWTRAMQQVSIPGGRATLLLILAALTLLFAGLPLEAQEATPTPTATSTSTPIWAPGRAHSLTATQSGIAIVLHWSAPEDGGEVTGYRIWRRLPDQGERDLLVLRENTGSAATSYIDDNAVAGQKHIYRVQALNSGGAGERSLLAQVVVAAYAAEPGGACVFYAFQAITGTRLHVKIPASNFLAGGKYPYYSDSNCETVHSWTVQISLGGMAYTSDKDRDAAWELCQANNSKKLLYISPHGSNVSPAFWSAFHCVVGDEDAPPGGQTERFMYVRSYRSKPENEEDWAQCGGFFRNYPEADDVFFIQKGASNRWKCMLSWTVGDTPTSTPTANASSTQSPTATDTPTATATDTPAPDAAPGRAHSLSAKHSGSLVALTWSAPADGGAVSGYRIWRRLPDQGERDLAVLVNDTGSAATSYHDVNAMFGQKHIYRVQALNSYGEGQASLAAEIMVRATTARKCLRVRTGAVADFLRFPDSNFLDGGPHTSYSDANCENVSSSSLWFAAGGLAHASNLDKAWEICVANSSKKLDVLYRTGTPTIFMCGFTDEDAPPGGQPERRLFVGQAGGETAEEALANCQSLEANTVEFSPPEHRDSVPDPWRCLYVWTLEAAPTPTATPTSTSAPNLIATSTPTATHTPSTQCASKPSKPTGVTATSTHNGIELSWDKPPRSENVQDIYIYRRLNEPGTQFTHYATATWAQTNPNDNESDYWTVRSLVDNHVEDGKSYAYRLRAHTPPECYSDLSNEVTLLWNATDPGAPTGLSATLNADNAPALSWTAPTVDAGHAAPHGYQVSRSADGKNTWTDLAVELNSVNGIFIPQTSYTDTASLSAGTYDYRVRAVRKRFPTAAAISNDALAVLDYGPWSATASVTLVSGSAHTSTPNAALTITAAALQTSSASSAPAAQAGCIQVGPGTYWHFPASNILSGEIAVHSSDQCTSAETTQQIGADGYVYTADGQSAADSLCQAGHGGGVYQAQQQTFNPELYACQFTPITATPLLATDTPIPPTDTPVPPASERQESASSAEKPGRAHSLTASFAVGSVALSWSAPEDGGAVSGYRIWRRLPDKGERELRVLVENTGSAATSYSDSGAVGRQKHIYRVQALGPGGAGEQSLRAEIIVWCAALTEECLEAFGHSPSDPAATATDRPANATQAAPKPGCVHVGPSSYWLFPVSNFLSGEIAVYNSNQCDSAGTTQQIGANGFVYTADGQSQSSAAALCQAGHGGGAYQAVQQAFNTSLFACQFVPPTDTPIPPTNTPLPTNTPMPPTNTPAPQQQQQPSNPPAQTKPGRAHNLSAAQSGSAVALNWSAPADGGAVSGYRIWRRLPDRGETVLVALVDNTGSAATGFTDNSAVAGQKHIYRVQALNSSGEGQISLPSQLVVKAPPTNTPIPPPPPTNTPIPPPPPTNTPAPKLEAPGRAHSLTATLSDGSVSLSWSAPDDGGAVNGYRIWRRLPDKGEQKLIALADNTGSAATSYVDSRAEDRQKHIYRVQALNAAGEGQRSKPAQIIVRR